MIRRLLAVLLVLAIPSVVVAQSGVGPSPIRVGSSGGSSTIIAGTTATSGCNDLSVLSSNGSVVVCPGWAKLATSGAFTIGNSSLGTSVVPLTVTPGTGCSGNLQNWTNSAGTVIANVECTGAFWVGNATGTGAGTWKFWNAPTVGVLGVTQFGQFAGTLPSTTSATTLGLGMNITSSGGSTSSNIAYGMLIQGGDAGSSPPLNYVGYFIDSWTGTNTVTGNNALAGISNGTTTGTNTGVFGAAVNAGAGLKVGGNFSLSTTRVAPAESAAGYFNNAAIAASIIVAADNDVVKWKIGDGGQPIYSTTVPAVSNTSANSCGTTAATIAGTNETGIITVGATSGTSCTSTFAIAAPTRRQCMAMNETSGLAVKATYSSTTVTIFSGTFGAGDVIAYDCTVY